MDNKNRAMLIEILHDMEDFAKLKGLKCPPIYLLGGSGCIAGGYINRATTDFDILNMDYPAYAGRIFRLLGETDYLDMDLTTIAAGFENRAIKLEEYKYLDIYVLSKEDIIVTKIGRYSEKDIQDIEELIKSSDKTLILDLIDKVNQRTDIGKKIKEEFIKNVTVFRRQFIV